MKKTTEYRITTNNSVYNKTRKWYLEATGTIRCAYCPYNKHENKRYGPWKRGQRSWKNYRKTQYK